MPEEADLGFGTMCVLSHGILVNVTPAAVHARACLCVCVCACVFAHLPVAHTRALRFHGGLMRLIGAQKYDQDTAVMHINMTWYDAVYLRSSARNLKDGGDRASRALGLLGKGLERYLGKMAGGKVPPQVVVTILGAYRVVRLPVLLFVCCVTGEA